MNDLRVSSYMNHVDIGDGTSLLYNGSSLCIDRLPTDYARKLRDNTDLSFLSPEEKEHLLRRGHLTRWSERRELEEFKKQVAFILGRIADLDKDRNERNLSFILTYNCNLSCTYCFQRTLSDKSRTTVMGGAFVDTFFAKYLPQLFPSAPKALSITLFGGEPLLPANREAIERILHFAKERDSTKVSVATNATTLSLMADLIAPEKGKIENVQVTFDGDQILHDENRIPLSGKPTFAAMIAAVRQLIDLGVHIGVRVHLHHGKLQSAGRFVDFLGKEGLLGHRLVHVYFSPINAFNSEQNTQEDFDIFCRTFQTVAARTSFPPSSFGYMNSFLEMQKEKVLPKVRFCGLGGESFYIVDPLGDIYACYEEAGHRDRRIGALDNGKVRFCRLRDTYSRRHLLRLPECVRCPAALFCGGGCPNQARIQNGSIFKSSCHQNREFIAQTLKAFFLRKEVKP